MRGKSFSKRLIVADYAVLAILLAASIILSVRQVAVDGLVSVTVAWIAQIAVSSGFYYWKAKHENLVKMPLQLIDGLSDEMKEKADPNAIIESVLANGRN